jgi:hypothetical protein
VYIYIYIRLCRCLHHLMMEAVRTSETSVNFDVTTRRYIPENSKLHTRRRENLKSHIFKDAVFSNSNYTVSNGKMIGE